MVIILQYQIGLYGDRHATHAIAHLNPGQQVQTYGIQQKAIGSNRYMIQVYVLGTNPVMSGWVFVDQLQ